MKDYDKSKYYVGAVVNLRKLPAGVTFVFDYNKLEDRGEYGEETWGEILYIGDDWRRALPERDDVDYMPLNRTDRTNLNLRRDYEVRRDYEGGIKMTKETMTVHKALAELKLLDDRITKAIADGIYCVAKKHSAEKIGGVTVDEYISIMQSRYDKANDLIKRRKAIKKAVVLSNAVTKVKIAGVEYTVAEAIEMKNHSIEFDKSLMDEMQQHYEIAQMTIKDENGKGLEERAEKYVTEIYGKKEGKSTDIEKVRTDFLTANQFELVDPLHILDKIEDLEKKTSDFMSEVDGVLSTSNALTEITIEY